MIRRESDGGMDAILLILMGDDKELVAAIKTRHPTWFKKPKRWRATA